jgi:hypothetical protein
LLTVAASSSPMAASCVHELTLPTQFSRSIQLAIPGGFQRTTAIRPFEKIEAFRPRQADTDELIAMRNDVENTIGRQIGRPVQLTAKNDPWHIYGYELPDDFLDNHPQWKLKQVQ